MAGLWLEERCDMDEVVCWRIVEIRSVTSTLLSCLPQEWHAMSHIK